MSFTSLSWVAFRCGGLRCLRVRSSRHAASGVVLVASFAAQGQAARFAAWSASKAGHSMFVRRLGGLWSVSVPLPPGASPVFVPVRGGVRGIAAALRALA